MASARGALEARGGDDPAGDAQVSDREAVLERGGTDPRDLVDQVAREADAEAPLARALEREDDRLREAREVDPRLVAHVRPEGDRLGVAHEAAVEDEEVLASE